MTGTPREDGAPVVASSASESEAPADGGVFPRRPSAGAAPADASPSLVCESLDRCPRCKMEPPPGTTRVEHRQHVLRCGTVRRLASRRGGG